MLFTLSTINYRQHSAEDDVPQSISVPSHFLAFLMTYSKSELKSNDIEISPYFRPF